MNDSDPDYVSKTIRARVLANDESMTRERIAEADKEMAKLQKRRDGLLRALGRVELEREQMKAAS